MGNLGKEELNHRQSLLEGKTDDRDKAFWRILILFLKIQISIKNIPFSDAFSEIY